MKKDSASHYRLRASSTFANKLEFQGIYVLDIGNLGKLFCTFVSQQDLSAANHPVAAPKRADEYS
jgi:hypothetical protein